KAGRTTFACPRARHSPRPRDLLDAVKKRLMPSEQEAPILIRRFRGVDVSQDPAFIGSDVLALSDSFTPNPIFILAKRQGQILLRQLSTDATGAITARPLLVRTYDDSGNRYLVAIIHADAGGLDTVVVSVNDAAFTQPANA